MISTLGGPSEGGSSLCAASKPYGPVALNAVAAQLDEFTSKFEKVMMPQPAHQTATSPEHCMAAIKCLQELEADNFDLNHLIALVDYFKSSSNAAVTYLSPDMPVLHHSWLQKQLVKTLGFPPLPSPVNEGSNGK